MTYRQMGHATQHCCLCTPRHWLLHSCLSACREPLALSLSCMTVCLTFKEMLYQSHAACLCCCCIKPAHVC